MNDKCHSCGIEGFVGPLMFPGDSAIFSILDFATQYEVPKNLAALFLHDEKLFCYPCYCLVTNTCIHCGEVKETLIRDKRCKNNLYLCEECIKTPTCVHLYKCYSDGCMSIEELAQQEFEIMREQDEMGLDGDITFGL